MHEKPKMELRDFFRHIDAAEFVQRFRGLLPAETSANPQEFVQRAEEAAGAIPLLLELGKQQGDAKRSGDTQGWERVTMLAVGIVTLFAMAEDMGYEW